MRNLNHDLVQETSELLDSIWRMDAYLQNAQEGGCDRCASLWKDLKVRLESHVEELRNEIIQHVGAGMFD